MLQSKSTAAPFHTAPVLCLIGTPSLRLWSHDTGERLLIQFSRIGLDETIQETQIATHDGPMILLRADAVLDQPLIPILSERPNLVLLGSSPGGEVPVAAHVLPGQAHAAAEVLRGKKPDLPPPLLARSPAGLDAAFWRQLRKREVPYAYLVDGRNIADVERRIFLGT